MVEYELFITKYHMNRGAILGKLLDNDADCLALKDRECYYPAGYEFSSPEETLREVGERASMPVDHYQVGISPLNEKKFSPWFKTRLSGYDAVRVTAAMDLIAELTLEEAERFARKFLSKKKEEQNV